MYMFLGNNKNMNVMDLIYSRNEVLSITIYKVYCVNVLNYGMASNMDILNKPKDKIRKLAC